MGRPNEVHRLAFTVVLAAAVLPGSVSANAPMFTLSPPSATLPLVPAGPDDVLRPSVPPVPGPISPPVVGIPASALGLLPGDVITSISSPITELVGTGIRVMFSVDAASTGVPFAPPPANVSCEVASGQGLADIFLSHPYGPPLPLANELALDGNGVADSACGPPAAPGLGLIEPSTDDVYSLDMCPSGWAFSNFTLQLNEAIYFTLAPSSPTLALLGSGASDILLAPPGGPQTPVVAITGGTGLGLAAPCPPGVGAPACDEIDAMQILPPSAAWISLAPGSPSLVGCGFSGADILLGPPAGPPACFIVIPASYLGLAPTDNVDALALFADVDGDRIPFECDNCPSAANNDQLDGDGDDIGDVCDACIGVGPDGDLDGYCDSGDNCPLVANPSQADTDGDGNGNACDPTFDCPSAPSSGCDAPGKSVLIIKDHGADGASASDKLTWKWARGPATTQAEFGDPLLTAAFGLCVYAGTAGLQLEANIPAGADWSALGASGYKYRDTSLAEDGIQKVLLRGSATPGKSKILVKGRDANLDIDPNTLPLDASAAVVVQLHSSDAGNCWEASFPPASIGRNEETLFKAGTP